MTKNALVSDIILRVTRGKPSDDLELEPKQVAYWIDLVGNALLPGFLNKNLTKGDSIDRDLVYRETCKAITQEDDPHVPAVDDRLYFSICKEPVDLTNDAGILRVITNTGQRIDRITLEDVDIVQDLTFGRASSESLRFYREQQAIIVLGIPPSMKDSVEIQIWYVPKLAVESLKDTDEVKLPDELLDAIMDAVEQKALRQLYGFEDIQNDGNQGFPLIPPIANNG
jgi:hypothetical protein